MGLTRQVIPGRALVITGKSNWRARVVGSHLVSSFVEMKLALSQEEESQCTVHRGNLRQWPSPACRRGTSGGSDSLTGASGAPRGDNRSAVAVGCNNVMSCGVINQWAADLDHVPAAASTVLAQWANHAGSVARRKFAAS